jgi:hypothetical protein
LDVTDDKRSKASRLDSTFTLGHYFRRNFLRPQETKQHIW